MIGRRFLCLGIQVNDGLRIPVARLHATITSMTLFLRKNITNSTPILTAPRIVALSAFHRESKPGRRGRFNPIHNILYSIHFIDAAFVGRSMRLKPVASF